MVTRWWRWGAAFAAEGVELVSEIIAVTGRKRFFEKLVNDGQEIVQGADGGKGRRVGSAETAAAGGQPQSVLDQGKGDAAITKLGG